MCVFFITFMKCYAIFNVTLINSEGVCLWDYLGCLNATITLKYFANLCYTTLKYYKNL